MFQDAIRPSTPAVAVIDYAGRHDLPPESARCSPFSLLLYGCMEQRGEEGRGPSPPRGGTTGLSKMPLLHPPPSVSNVSHLLPAHAFKAQHLKDSALIAIRGDVRYTAGAARFETILTWSAFGFAEGGRRDGG